MLNCVGDYSDWREKRAQNLRMNERHPEKLFPNNPANTRYGERLSAQCREEKPLVAKSGSCR
jgi:hypothetical protein